ncbi:hypothetical protein D9757_004958 [Collybiopsis confluens]|uniref:Uncharacterized protein n=1 Tax=Collybiopsis confluens TaxID=2823264 RepID=A0A8H5HTA0_9AGAR|nr:hypothetical protein D9757_004958 [Collybiopsis confluens]
MSTEMITAIVDWDLCGLACVGGEYARAAGNHIRYGDQLPGVEDYFHVLLRHSIDRTGEELVLGYSEKHRARYRTWPLVKSKSYTLTYPPVADPRNQSRQKIRPIRKRRVRESKNDQT